MTTTVHDSIQRYLKRTFPSFFLYISGNFPSSVHQTRIRKGLTSYQRYLSHKYTVQSVLEDVAISFDCIQEFTPPNFFFMGPPREFRKKRDSFPPCHPFLETSCPHRVWYSTNSFTSWSTIHGHLYFLAVPSAFQNLAAVSFIFDRQFYDTLKYIINSRNIRKHNKYLLKHTGYMFRAVNRSSSGFQQNKSKVLLRNWDPNVFYNCKQV